MKTKKNNTKKEQITAQVENQEIVANATKVTNPTSSQEDNSIKENLEAIASGKKNKKSKKDKKTKKAEVIEVPVAKSKKKKDKVVKDVAKKQKASIKEKVVSEREVKYIYPLKEDENTGEMREMTKDEKKSWRQATRNEYRSLEREMNRFIQDQSSKEYKAAKKAFDAFTAQVLKPGMAI
jgi:hypothetical protein